MTDSVVHFEIPADDVKRANKFYGSIFGWDSQKMPGLDYHLFHTGPTDKKTGMVQKPGFINGGLMKREKPFKGPIVTIAVEKLDATMKKIEKNGGKIVSSRETVPHVGDIAYFEDPEGNVIGLIQPLMPGPR
jgi:predicted enzyme related to lactoylglutathione lyase